MQGYPANNSDDDFDTPILAKAPGVELEDRELTNVFNYPRNLHELYEMGELELPSLGRERRPHPLQHLVAAQCSRSLPSTHDQAP